MTLAQDFAEMTQDQIAVRSVSSRDKMGKETLGPPATYDCRLVRSAKQVTDAAGNQVVSTAHASVIGAPTFSTQDRITLPDGTTPSILSIDGFPDETGQVVEQVVYFGNG